MSKHLFVVRHAKAEGSAFRDLERVLAPRGRRDSTLLGRWLETQSVTRPALAYVSGAARTQESWERMSTELSEPIAVEVRADLYGAGTDEVRGLIAATPDTVQTVLVVGHNPTMAGVVWELSSEVTSAAKAFESRGFPTAACAVLEMGTWDASLGRIAQFVVPADLRD